MEIRSQHKVCRKCGIEKQIACFPAHPTMKDGHLNHCQSCINADVRARYAKKPKIKKTKPTKDEKLAALPRDFKLKCKQCSIEKPLTEFAKEKLARYGVRNACKECTSVNSKSISADKRKEKNAKAKAWRHANPLRALTHSRSYAEKNKEKRLQERKEYRLKNIENERAREKRYLKNNRPVIYAKNARRRAAETKAVPRWLNWLQKIQIKEFYEIAAARTMQTGEKHHVDHIVPLRGDGVNGLHVPWNLQILTEFENCSKHNKVFQGSA